MIVSSPSLGSGICSANFYCDNDNEIIQKNKELQSFIRVSLFVSDEETGILLASNIINTAKVVRLFIINDDNVSKYVLSEMPSETVLSGLSICDIEPLSLFTSEPIKPNKDVFLDFENSYDIRFRGCDEFAEFEVYERLLHALSNIYDVLIAKSELERIKGVIKRINPLLQGAKVNRLLGYNCQVFEEQSVSTLADICNMKSWDNSYSVAKGISSAIEKKLKMLIVPQMAIELLTNELSKREKYIIENRYLKVDKTLEELGSELGLTRERIRQIASKVERKFRASRDKRALITALFFTLKALCECEHCITVCELTKYDVSENALTYLSDLRGGRMLLAHIPETDCIPFYGKDSKCAWLGIIERVTEAIPSLLLPDEQQNIINEVSSSLLEAGYFIPENIIVMIAFRKFVKNGTVLVKKSLRMGDRYEIVLEKFFPDGIRPYQAEDMELFRKGYDSLFDDDKISGNDHAVVVRITDRCVLIDRGKYILNKKTKLPAELSQRILEFILQYPVDMIMTNAIMHRFNVELSSIGVDNKYHLLSVLKQYFSNKFIFRRDYVIKGDPTGNFYGNITGFVESKPEGVSFHDLQVHFQGIPDAVLYFALSEDDSIIPMYNKMYIHKSNIIFPEQRQVLSFLQEAVSQEHIVSDEQAYGFLRREYPDFIANNNINTSWFLFSILRSFFQDEFQFARPHIIDSSFDSANGREALKSSFWGKRYVDIADIKNYAKVKQIQIYDLSKLLDSYSDRYFIFNKEQLINIDEIGYSPEEFVQVENIVLESLGNFEYSEIAKLNVINLLPRANIALTEWLIYSIINKYGTRISATTSTPQFMNSVPLVVRNGADIESIRDEYASSDTSAQTIKIDDLSDIDSLVEEVIDLNFIWEEGAS